jgi:phosphatidylserine/phosphatidylglycerophosphate/cardiolipin synthase-like enzyme
MIKSLIKYAIVLSMLASTAAADTGWWRVYFSTPWISRDRVDVKINPEHGIIRLINKTEKSFFGAFYEISSPAVADALIEARGRGIDVGLVIEKSNSRMETVSRMTEAGIKIVTDDSRALMHNKFAVSDGKIIWTGSYNLTLNDAYKNNNNAIEIRSHELAGIYLDEFNEMFRHGVFGNKREHGLFGELTHKYYVKIGDTNINAFFSPENGIERIIINRLKKAKKSIRFMAFSFTSPGIADTMIRCRKNGISVSGIMETRGSGTKHSQYRKMKVEDIQVRLDSNKRNMHHKVIIIDDDIVITGSYNFSKGADRRNDENILILDNRDIAAVYIKEFNELYDNHTAE